MQESIILFEKNVLAAGGIWVIRKKMYFIIEKISFKSVTKRNQVIIQSLCNSLKGHFWKSENLNDCVIIVDQDFPFVLGA